VSVGGKAKPGLLLSGENCGMSDEIVRECLVKSNENLDLLDRELVQQKKDPRNRDTLARVFRTIHTIKGTCGFLGFTQLKSVAHVGEKLLSKLRDGKLALSPELTNALLHMVDAIRQMMQSIEADGHEGDRNDQDLIKTLTQLQRGKSVASASAPNESIPVAPSLDAPAVDAATKPELAAPTTQLPKSELSKHPLEAVAESAPEPAETAAQAPNEAAQAQGRGTVSEGSIRVDVVLLDKLMNLVGELVLARNQILQFTNATEDVASSRRASA
jgi:two-component system, chemotaxis family, sensor kinase CheA